MLLREAILAQGFSFGTSKISVPYTFFNDLGLVEGFEPAPNLAQALYPQHQGGNSI